ncbi:MAG: hypothetical protein QM831_43040 [Kofleriaceae bacterium]
MSDWMISFNAGQTPHSYQEHVDAIAGAFGPVTATAGELSGNPRDYYYRTHTIKADHTIVVQLSENTRGEGDPEAYFSLSTITLLDDVAFAERMKAWAALVTAFAKLGYIDNTYRYCMHDIVNDARAEGETAIADRLVRETTEKLVAEAPTWTSINMPLTPGDRAAVIRACNPELVTSATIEHGELPLVRAFSKLTMLELPDLDEIRGCTWFPNLERLSGGIDRLTRDHVATFPKLERLFMRAVRVVDHDLLEAIPKLEAINIYDTQLAANTRDREALQKAWPNVRIWYDITQGYVG